MGQGREDMAKGGVRPFTGAALFLGGVACGGRRACSPLDLGCEGCPRARGVPVCETPERAGEDRGVAVEPTGRAVGLWRPPPALDLLLAAGLDSGALRSGALRSGAVLTDFLEASVGSLGRVLGAALGTPTSMPTARDRREMAGEGMAGVDPEESFRAPALRALLLGASGAFPLATDSSAGGRSPFCPGEPSLVGPLARPGLETQLEPGVLARARSPFPAPGGLEAGLRGPVPALRVCPTLGEASARAVARMPPARSARGPRPAAPAAPRTRRAALVTGGGGRGDPGGLGIGRPGEREAGVRPATPALDLSLLSIPHLWLRPPAAPRSVSWGGAG